MTTTLTKRNGANGSEAVERTRDTRTYSPRFDIWETEDEIVLCGDLPGVRPDDVDVNFENGQLTIYGKIATPEERQHLYTEYGVGDYHRTFAIGEAIDTEKISAEMKHGVLTLHLAKSEKVKPRRIEVKAN